MQSLKCQNCGSTNIEVLKDKMTCNHCGASFVTPKIERYTTSNWDYSNDINDYKSACFGVLRAGITLTQQEAQAYNNNLSLW